jgi:hypothetical protein
MYKLSYDSKNYKIDINKRGEYLQDIGATWSTIANNYLSVYTQLIKLN